MWNRKKFQFVLVFQARPNSWYQVKLKSKENDPCSRMTLISVQTEKFTGLMQVLSEAWRIWSSSTWVVGVGEWSSLTPKQKHPLSSWRISTLPTEFNYPHRRTFCWLQNPWGHAFGGISWPESGRGNVRFLLTDYQGSLTIFVPTEREGSTLLSVLIEMRRSVSWGLKKWGIDSDWKDSDSDWLLVFRTRVWVICSDVSHWFGSSFWGLLDWLISSFPSLVISFQGITILSPPGCTWVIWGQLETLPVCQGVKLPWLKSQLVEKSSGVSKRTNQRQVPDVSFSKKTESTWFNCVTLFLCKRCERWRRWVRGRSTPTLDLSLSPNYGESKTLSLIKFKLWITFSEMIS